MINGLSEETMIKGCAKGDPDCQRALYENFKSKMYGICLRYSKDQHLAQDLLQEGFINVYRKIDSFRFEGSFEGWMRRVFVNVSLEHHRRLVYMYPIQELSKNGHDEEAEEIISQMAYDDLLALLHKLPSGYRTVFNLYAIEGFSHKEIAEKLGISEGTSKSQLARSRVALQKMILEINPVQHEAYS